MAIDDVYQLQLHYTFAGQQLMNTLAFRMRTAPDPTNAMFLALANDFKDQWRPVQSFGVAWLTWQAQQVRGGTVSYTAKPCQRDGGRRLEGLLTGTLTGDNVGEALPPQAAVVTTLYTEFSGRAKRGRVYLGGLPESAQSSGIVTSGNVSTLQTSWDTQVAQYGDTGSDPNFELGIWSMRTATGCIPNKNPPYGMIFTGVRDPAAAFTAVDRATVRNIVYSQRKRTVGHGI
jgi:hypothetical protein